MLEDDDQAIYQDLKGSHPSIIRTYYADENFAKGLLPYCSRCGFHIALAAEAFFKKHQVKESIRKVFLPLKENKDEDRVRIIGCAAPSTAVEQVERFIDEHRSEIEARREALLNGKEKDPFLLVLTFANNLGFLGSKNAARLSAVVDEWQLADRSVGEDFLRVLVYRQCGRFPRDNYALRRVLFYEDVDEGAVREVLKEAANTNRALCEPSPELVAGPLETCTAVLQVLEDEAMKPDEKAASLAELISIDDVEQLVSDLEALVSPKGEVTLDEEDEEIWTAGRASPVKRLTMSGAKGLSADHVIVLGCDQQNMSHASPQVFFRRYDTSSKEPQLGRLFEDERCKGASSLPRAATREQLPVFDRHARRTEGEEVIRRLRQMARLRALHQEVGGLDSHIINPGWGAEALQGP